MFTGALLVKKYNVFCKTPRFLSRRRNNPLLNPIISQLSRLCISHRISHNPS